MKNLENEIAAIRFGTELEYNNISRAVAARAIHSITGGRIVHEGGCYDKWVVIAPDGRKWSAIFDSSIGESRDESVKSCAEIVTPILNFDDIEMLQNIVRALRAAGARATARGSQHVHIGARGYLNARQIANLAKIFYRQESIILRAAGTYESRLGRWCRPMDSRFIARLNAARFAANDAENDRKLNSAWFDYREYFRPDHYDSNRYRALNLNNLWRDSGTIEFRYFNASTHAGKIKFNIMFCLALAAMAKNSRAASAGIRREYCAESGKYDLRVFLLRMGMIGEFWRNARAYYLENIGGSAAWKHGRPAGR